MKNIELKIKVDTFKKIEKSLKILGAKYEGELIQKDIYFNCTKGRLKIREINGNNFELIFYERQNRLINKLSNYFIVEFSSEEIEKIKTILSLSLGIKTVVSKKRDLWLFKNTRIHLDGVNKLGKFLELETVLGKISRKQGEKEYMEIYNSLKLSEFKKIDKSYGDLLIKF